MLLILPLMYCSTFVVKVIHKDENGGKNALYVSDNRVALTGNLEDDGTEFVLSNEASGSSSMVDISPIRSREKKLVADENNYIKVAGNERGYPKWKIKKEHSRHKLMFEGRCLDVREGTARLEECRDDSPNQAFMITSQENRSRGDDQSSGEGIHSHMPNYREGSYLKSPEATYEKKDVYEYKPEPVLLKKEVVPAEKPENVHFIVTSTEVLKSILTLTDTTLKTTYETQTVYVTSTVTETKVLDYTSTKVVGETVTTTISSKTPHSKAKGRPEPMPSKKVVKYPKEDSSDISPMSFDMPQKKGKKKLKGTLKRPADKKRDYESDSSTEGLESLIKAFVGDKNDTELLDINTPKMFSQSSKVRQPVQNSCSNSMMQTVDLRALYQPQVAVPQAQPQGQYYYLVQS